MSDIKFGTDGWRGVIASDFTFNNIKIVAQAIADYLNSGTKVAIGYDTRFMSKEFAHLIAKVCSGNDIKTIISPFPTPTPMLSYFVQYGKFNGGIMVTASHNPYIYNGIKFKEPYGCSSLTVTTQHIENFLNKTNPKMSETFIEESDMENPYISALDRYIIPEYVEKKSLRIIIDSMYGAGGYYLEKILKKYGHKVLTIHGNSNPNFPEINPEPIDINLIELSKKVKESKADIGIATDGDADRVGIVDNKGNVLTPHYVLSLLFLHLKTTRKWPGVIVKTISSTSLINKIADKYSMTIKETPVGFKYIAELMLSSDVLIGGEESGGNGFKNHIPERDGFLSGLLLVEMLGERKKKLTEVVKDMEKEFGAYKYKRVDMHVPREKIIALFERLKNNPPKDVGGNKVEDVRNNDGVKFVFKDKSWLLIRASGTEPILRIYSEANSDKKVLDLINAGKALASKK